MDAQLQGECGITWAYQVEAQIVKSWHSGGLPLASPKVTGGAVGLRPDLIPPAKLFNRKASIAAETHLGKKLMEEGYEVVGPQGLG